MAVYRSKREISRPIAPATLTMVAMLVLLSTCMNTNCCRAAVLLESNVTYQNCGNGGLADEYYCRLIAEDLELELLFDTHVSRMLGGQEGSGGTSGTPNPNHPAKPCGNTGNGEQYCNSKGGQPKQPCGKFNRNCG